MVRPVLIVFCALVCLIGCDQESGENVRALALRAPDQQERAAAQPVADAENRFGLSMMSAVLPDNTDANFCFSPVSLYQAFCLLLNGSAGPTRSLLEKELGFKGATVDSINSGNFGLLAQMVGKDLSTANSIWVTPDVKPKSGFVKSLTDFYSADFKDGGDFDTDTVRRVNAWVKEKTRGMIPQLVDRFPNLTALVLINAMAFEGKWVSAFDRNKTRELPFELPSGERIDVPTMSQKGDFKVAMSGTTQALWMPYQDNALEFVAILPPQGVTASAYLKNLDTDEWQKLCASPTKQEVTVMLPRFQMRTGGDITAQLKRTQLAPLFVEMDLSGVSDQLATDVRIGQVVQKCFVSVDEEGTKAAAATEIAVERKSLTRSFVANRPFVFALVHAPTNAIVMIGVVNDPRG